MIMELFVPLSILQAVILQKLETLLNGGYILQRIDENLTYDYLHSSEDNLWSILYLTGYLTSIRENELKETSRWDFCTYDTQCRNTGNI